MANTRGILEGTQPQGEDEIITYSVTTTNIGSSPTSPSVVVLDVRNDYSDVTGTVMPTNSPTVAGDVITLSPLRALTRGRVYQVQVQCIIDGNTVEIPFWVQASR